MGVLDFGDGELCRGEGGEGVDFVVAEAVRFFGVAQAEQAVVEVDEVAEFADPFHHAFVASFAEDAELRGDCPPGDADGAFGDVCSDNVERDVWVVRHRQDGGDADGEFAPACELLVDIVDLAPEGGDVVLEETEDFAGAVVEVDRVRRGARIRWAPVADVSDEERPCVDGVAVEGAVFAVVVEDRQVAVHRDEACAESSAERLGAAVGFADDRWLHQEECGEAGMSFDALATHAVLPQDLAGEAFEPDLEVGLAVAAIASSGDAQDFGALGGVDEDGAVDVACAGEDEFLARDVFDEGCG